MLGTLFFWIACLALGASALVQSVLARARYRDTIRTVAELCSQDPADLQARPVKACAQDVTIERDNATTV